MHQADFRFYGELNDFLPPHQRQVTFTHTFDSRASIKDMIEALGAPHPEIDQIWVNGESVDFSYIVENGDQISVYPVSQSLGLQPKVQLQPPPLLVPRFILDIHLGRLATSLRMLGFDTLYRNDYPDEELAEVSSQEKRILLTRDRGLLKRSIVTYGYYVRATNPQLQLSEVMQRFNLSTSATPFQRCLNCNGLLKSVPKESIIDQLPLKTRQTYNEFGCCLTCGQIFWKGSHYQQMVKFIEQVLESSTKGDAHDKRLGWVKHRATE